MSNNEGRYIDIDVHTDRQTDLVYYILPGISCTGNGANNKRELLIWQKTNDWMPRLRLRHRLNGQRMLECQVPHPGTLPPPPHPSLCSSSLRTGDKPQTTLTTKTNGLALPPWQGWGWGCLPLPLPSLSLCLSVCVSCLWLDLTVLWFSPFSLFSLSPGQSYATHIMC